MSETKEMTLREVTKETLGSILSVKTLPEQEKFVANNAESIAEAHFHENAWYRGVYADEEPVGFVMLSIEPEKPEYCVWRFMIGADHQRKGYGQRAMKLIVDHVRTLPDATQLFLSCCPGEGSPGPFYEKLGYVYTGDEDEGELVMKLELR